MRDYSHYIKTMSDKTGKTYRELGTMWKKAQREFEFDQMLEPKKYQALKKLDGSIAEEIGRRFEKLAANQDNEPGSLEKINAIEPTVPAPEEASPFAESPFAAPEAPTEIPPPPFGEGEIPPPPFEEGEAKTPEEIEAELKVGGNELNEFPNL